MLGAATVSTILPSPARALVMAGRNPRLDEAVERLRTYVKAERRRYRVPGIAVSLVDQTGNFIELSDGFVDLEGRKPVEAGHLFQIGSITKSFAALIAFQLAEQKKLDLDAPISRYLVGQPLPAEPISARQLIQHTAGIADGAPLVPRGVGRLWTGYPPGSRFRYSNTGYALLGAVLEACAGQPFDELARERIFAPLAMSSATAQIDASERERYAAGYCSATGDYPASSISRIVPAPWVDFTGAAGSIAATTRDMSKYLAFLLRLAGGNPSPILSKASALEFLRPGVATPERGPNTSYANGLFVSRADGVYALHHTGGMLAYSSAMRVDRSAGTACFASANLTLGGYRPRAIVDYGCLLLEAAARNGAWPEPPRIVPAATVTGSGKYVGTYKAANGKTIRIEADPSGIILVADKKRIRLETGPGSDLFAVPDPDFAIYPLGFGGAGGEVTYAFHGSLFLVKSGQRYDGRAGEMSAIIGSYLCENPWRGTTRIVSRPDGLFRDGYVPLVAIGDNIFREGAEDWSPERAQFDAFVNGRSTRLVRSGVDYLRVSSPT